MSNSIHCPNCNKSITWDKKNKYRPFCSKKCQLIDFGNWASENYKITPYNPDKEKDNTNF